MTLGCSSAAPPLLLRRCSSSSSSCSCPAAPPPRRPSPAQSLRCSRCEDAGGAERVLQRPSDHEPIIDELISRSGSSCGFMSVCPPNISRPVFVPSQGMTEVMISSSPMEDMRLSPSKDRLSFQIFPDPSDFDRCCKLKDRLPSIVVEPTEGEVESGELRWPPEEFLVSEEEEEEEDDDNNEDEGESNGNIQNGHPTADSQH